jgi:NADH-quinone oxidoreductase subunit G
MATIYIENRPHDIPDGQNVLAACLALGFDLPFFCWHPALGSVGACRQCAVKQFKDEHDTTGTIVMACLTPAVEGTRISIQDPEARAFRASVAEWLMANHPHDCPVCDEGGECHLQDMTVMTGHWRRRYRFPKRTFRNQDLGPFISHEMNRCIQCYRCVRFYADYAGGDDLVAMGTGDHVYFGRHQDGKLESEFSGNLVEVCPTGVFTDKTFRQHYTRKWDLQTAPSICIHCGLGCNTIPGERYGTLRRVRSRYNGAVNGYFICDRGRFGYEFVNAESRIRSVVTREELHGGSRIPGADDVVRHVAGLVVSARTRKRRVIGIGSPRASLEANFALRRLVGKDDFYMGVSEQDRRLVDAAREILSEGPARSCSTRDLERADAMLVIGEDVTNTAPMLGYSLRQWLRRRPTPEQIALEIPEWNDAAVGEIVHEEPSALHVLNMHETKLDRLAVQVYHAAPADLARLGFAAAHLLDEKAPSVPHLRKDLREHAASIAAAFTKAERPIVVSGTSSGSEDVLWAAASVAWSLHARGKAAELCLVVPECNSLGASLIGGGRLEEAFAAADRGEVEAVLILENDLHRRAAGPQVERFLTACGQVVVLDHTHSATSRVAHVVLPAATYAEDTGSLVNNEGRAQRYYQVFPAGGQARGSEHWLTDIEAAVTRMAENAADEGLCEGGGAPAEGEGSVVDSLLSELAGELPVFLPLVSALAPASLRVEGMKVARQSHRHSGRTAVDAAETVFEPRPLFDSETPLAFSAEGFQGQPPAALVPRFWSPGWNSVQAVNKYQHGADQPLLGVDTGTRLIEPADVSAVAYRVGAPASFPLPREGYLVVPVHSIFGSEELSMRSPSVASCAPRPFVGLGADGAAALDLDDGDLVWLEWDDRRLQLPVKIVPTLAPGVAGLPVGLSGLEGIIPPFHARLRTAGSAEPPAEDGTDV